MGSILSCDITKLRFFTSSLSLNFQWSLSLAENPRLAWPPVPSTVRPLLAGRTFSVLAGACRKFGTEWAGLRLIHHRYCTWIRTVLGGIFAWAGTFPKLGYATPLRSFVFVFVSVSTRWLNGLSRLGLGLGRALFWVAPYVVNGHHNSMTQSGA